MPLNENLCIHSVDYVLQSLNELDQKRYERHLAQCRKCQQDCDELFELVTLVENDFKRPSSAERKVVPLFDYQSVQNKSRRRRMRYKFTVPMALLLMLSAWTSAATFHKLPTRTPASLRESFADIRNVAATVQTNFRHIHFRKMEQEYRSAERELNPWTI